MNNFENVDKGYRERVAWMTSDLVREALEARIKMGATFDAKATMKIFNDSVDYARMITDLEISSGLEPLEKEDKDAKCNIKAGDPEGSTSDRGNEGRVRNPNPSTESSSNNGTTGSGEVNPPKQQPKSPQPRSGTRGGHGSRPESLEVDTTP